MMSSIARCDDLLSGLSAKQEIKALNGKAFGFHSDVARLFRFEQGFV